MRSQRSIIVTSDPHNAMTFEVVVREREDESRHRVTITAIDAARYCASGIKPKGCVEVAMAFVLDREPKESILGAFDIGVIRRYFPEFDDAFPTYLAWLVDKSTGGLMDAKP
jgi:hypothetical protein